MEKQLLYKRAAEHFEEALPIGNGALGAMLYGGAECEKITLNADTLYSGTSTRHEALANAPKMWAEIGRLCANGMDAAARDLANEFAGEDAEMYLPLAEMRIDTAHTDITNYSRRLVLPEGIAYTEYTCDGVKYRREAFASKDYNCIAVHFSADVPGSINLQISFTHPLKITGKSFTGNIAVFDGVCPDAVTDRQKKPKYSYKNTAKSIHFTDIFRIETARGETFSDKNALFVRNADEATIYVYAETSFGGKTEYRDTCLQNAQRQICYSDVKNAHIKDFSSLYNRTEISFTDEMCDLPTDERLKNFDGDDLGLYELLFDFGKYLLISSSREGSAATNLQGIWNEEIFPPWNSAYTLNINTEMNYWPAHPTDLGECFKPFIALAEKLCESGKITAREYYDAPGFVCHHNSDIWGITSPVGKGAPSSYIYGFWNMASGWIACQLFDEYEYTMDTDALEKRIYPIMKEAAEFYLHIMVRDENGKYMVSPSTSPENQYFFDGKEESSVSRTTAMSASIVYELFTKLIQCCDILQKDFDFAENLKSILPDLYLPQAGTDGKLKEWYEEREEKDRHHRHVSHLFGLYPGNTISLDKTPELAEACRKSLTERGDAGTGWSLAWKVCLWARLCDGNHVLQILTRQLNYVDPTAPMDYDGKGGTYPNFTDAHPPFQIDGNFGVCAGICEMFIQSEPGRIKLLPALPDKFRKGYVRGLKAKGNIKISIEWDNGTAVKVRLSSPIAQKVELCFGGKTSTAELKPHEVTELTL